jgi:hypothetical protein
VAEFHESQIRELTPDPDGVNKVFETPTKFVAGSFRLIWNGQVYDPTDSYFGWTETSDALVTLITAPRAGDTLQAFYQDKDAAGQIGLDDVRGSPFDPTGVLP